MKKKSIFTVVLIATALCLKNVPSGGTETSLLLSNVEALSDDSNEKTKCSRVIASCACWKGSNFLGMAIKDCEDYEWQAPMQKQYCSVTHCQSGSACK